MQQNPYSPPAANVDLVSHASPIPDAIRKKVRNAAVAGLISASFTLAFALLAASGRAIAGFGIEQLIDVILILGLTFGIYRKSRICAVLMLIYFTVSKVWLIWVSGQFNGVLVAVAFLYLYAQGVAGTFAFHKWNKGLSAASSSLGEQRNVA